jgi:hypothetical protein
VPQQLDVQRGTAEPAKQPPALEATPAPAPAAAAAPAPAPVSGVAGGHYRPGCLPPFETGRTDEGYLNYYEDVEISCRT